MATKDKPANSPALSDAAEPAPLAGYDDFLRDLKDRIRAAQVRAALAVNRELVMLYWRIGRDILARQQQQGWGAKVITCLSRDLRAAFPDMQGFSLRNLDFGTLIWPTLALKRVNTLNYTLTFTYGVLLAFRGNLHRISASFL